MRFWSEIGASISTRSERPMLETAQNEAAKQFGLTEFQRKQLLVREPAHFRRNKYRWFAEPESGRCPNGSLKNLHLRFEDGDKYRGKQQRENECRFL